MDRLEPDAAPAPSGDERERIVQDLYRDIERSGVLPEKVAAFEAADAVLCALEMRLPRAEAEEVAHELPQALQLLIGRCVIHRTDRPEISFGQLAFLRLVASALGISVEQGERVTRAVFAAVQKLLAEDEVLDVRARLPRELAALWYPLGQTGVEPFEEPPPEPAETAARPVEEPAERILRELETSGVLPAGLSAVDATQAVLCTLSLELTEHEAQALAAFSTTFQHLLAPCGRHRGARQVHQPPFLERLVDHLGVDRRRAEQIARTVLAALRGRLAPEELHRIDSEIPRAVRRLWE
ncbi:MAG: DUF2267 domain-containing protein [Deltaproteobacteria bacterium]|nr:DUF2267 domain-containing protein [Deltaproteobacteria bacterium]MCW5807220.1 DUF2267 domain-containing protein [Deltaproteobacteria bacterium]